ncbi:hypothetical protein YYG_01206 [Plasmodium vinckei petteri]|uniref:Uncharacterized protein n=1 Tax=Plasmodium vinckei petteri TaxID=138298 RepID=W7B5F4_PLAVN|nr:hypothetical protein YYG_01206 [Plasmodium vinckei petteri]CAD2108177.1 conserved Plasmodium protein, unknown function [Plasmodium vinckei petteri]
MKNMHFLKRFNVYFIQIGKRDFAVNVERGLKPSSLRVRGNKNNFNDIINKYYPNRVLKKEKNELNRENNTDCDNKKYYISEKVKRKMKLLNNQNGKLNMYSELAIFNEDKKKKKKNQTTESTNENMSNSQSIITQDIKREEGNIEKKNETLEISKEEHDIQKYKNKIHKKIWISLKKNNKKDFEYYYDILNKYPLKDEVSYSILLHGKIIISDGQYLEESFNILNEMKLKKIHPSLIRFNERLLCSYVELTNLNSRPNIKQWVKVLRCVWFTSALVKARRQKYILRNINNVKKNKSVELSNFKNIFNIHNLAALYAENKDPLTKGYNEYLQHDQLINKTV